MATKRPTRLEQSILASVEAEMEEPRLTSSVRRSLDGSTVSGTIAPEVVRSQIAILRRSLADNERSWKATGLDHLQNPTAVSIRWDIEEKERLLGLSAL